MKDKEKQIEEMAFDLTMTVQRDYYGHTLFKETAERLIKQGYRKLPENAFILTDDNAEELANLIVTSPQMQSAMSDLIKAWQKETAERDFNTIIKKLETKKASIMTHYGVKESVGADIAIRTVKELAKQFGVEIKE